MLSLVQRMCRSRALQLAFLAFVVYNANLRSVTSLDTYATRVLPISILREADLDLDEFPFLHEYPKWIKTTEEKEAYWVRDVRGHKMPSYPVMPAILSVPVYAVPVMLGLTEGPASPLGYTRTEIVATLLGKISASGAVAFSVALVYWMLLRVTTRRGALWIALVYAFATASWSSTSQGLWQTAWSQPLMALALYGLVRAREEPRFAIWAGIPLALGVACRPPVIIFAAVFAVYVLAYYRRQAAAFLVIPAIIGGMLLAYNYYYFGNLVGGYAAVGAATQFNTPRVESFLGLLASPSRGLFMYSPVLLFAFAGLGAVLRRPRDPLMTAVGIATGLTVIFYSAWEIWDAAFAYGYRFLVDVLPGLCLFLAAGWNWIQARRWRFGLFLAAAAFSVFLQGIGAFNFPCGWYDTPVRAKEHRARLWDWRDPEWVRCLCAGPVEPDGLRFLRSVIDK